MAYPTLVTGNDISLPVQLKKNGAVFEVPAATSIVKARLVSADNTKPISEVFPQVSTATGADWDTSLIVVEMPELAVEPATFQGACQIELSVDDGGKLSWFIPVRVVTGNT